MERSTFEQWVSYPFQMSEFDKLWRNIRVEPFKNCGSVNSEKNKILQDFLSSKVSFIVSRQTVSTANENT